MSFRLRPVRAGAAHSALEERIGYRVLMCNVLAIYQVESQSLTSGHGGKISYYWHMAYLPLNFGLGTWGSILCCAIEHSKDLGLLSRVACLHKKFKLKNGSCSFGKCNQKGIGIMIMKCVAGGVCRRGGMSNCSGVAAR